MKKEFYDRGVCVADMADWLGLSLWGYAPNGSIRVGKVTDSQPTSVMTDAEIKEQFDAVFEIVPARPGGKTVKVIARLEVAA